MASLQSNQISVPAGLLALATQVILKVLYLKQQGNRFPSGGSVAVFSLSECFAHYRGCHQSLSQGSKWILTLLRPPKELVLLQQMKMWICNADPSTPLQTSNGAKSRTLKLPWRCGKLLTVCTFFTTVPCLHLCPKIVTSLQGKSLYSGCSFKTDWVEWSALDWGTAVRFEKRFMHQYVI